MSDPNWPIAALQAELSSTSLNPDETEAGAEPRDIEQLSISLFGLLASVPEVQCVPLKVVQDADWLIGYDTALSWRLQGALVRGVVAGSAANKPSKPKAFLRDVTRSVDEMLTDSTPVGGISEKDMLWFSKLLHKARRGRMEPRKIDENRLVSWCARLDVDPLRLVDAFVVMAMPATRTPALMQGAGSSDEWEHLRRRVERATELTIDSDSIQ